MGTSAGYVGTGAKFYSLDESSVIAGRTFTDVVPVFYPDDKPTEHVPYNDDDYLEDAA